VSRSVRSRIRVLLLGALFAAAGCTGSENVGPRERRSQREKHGIYENDPGTSIDDWCPPGGGPLDDPLGP
jgi:hypothetical protein